MVKTCDSCALDFVTRDRACLFCGSHLRSLATLARNPVTYPKKQNTRKNWQQRKRNIRFGALVISGLLVLLNIATWQWSPVWWSLVVILSYLYLARFNTVYFTDFWQGKFGRSIMTHYIFLSLLLVGIDSVFGFQGWSFTYVIPVLRSVSTLMIGTLAVYQGNLWTDEISYLLMIIATNLLSIPPLFLGKINVVWPNLVAAIVALLVLAYLFIVMPRQMKAEIKKKLHY